MKKTHLAVFLTALLLSSAATAQSSFYGQQDATDYFRASLVGKTIDGHTFTKDTDIRASAFNGNHAAFLARWTNGKMWQPAYEQYDALFADGRLVVRQGETIDGVYFAAFGDYNGEQRISINSQGHVAYTAWYGESAIAAMGGDGRLGVWVDRHLIATMSLASQAPDVMMTDAGELLIRQLDWHLKTIGYDVVIPIDPAVLKRK